MDNTAGPHPDISVWVCPGWLDFICTARLLGDLMYVDVFDDCVNCNRGITLLLHYRGYKGYNNQGFFLLVRVSVPKG